MLQCSYTRTLSLAFSCQDKWYPSAIYNKHVSCLKLNSCIILLLLQERHHHGAANLKFWSSRDGFKALERPKSFFPLKYAI